MSNDEMSKQAKLDLLDKLGLKPSKNFGETREKVWRPGNASYWNRVVGSWHNHDGVSENSIRRAKSLAGQRNRARRK
jgi:hypothetical protein